MPSCADHFGVLPCAGVAAIKGQTFARPRHAGARLKYALRCGSCDVRNARRDGSPSTTSSRAVLGNISLALVLIAALPATAQSPPDSRCVIKGNVNAKGERIYHPPGWRYYGATVIDPRRGERWFCSEREAQAAGWRRTKVC